MDSPKGYFMITKFLVTALVIGATSQFAFSENWSEGMKEGNVKLKSAGPISFGPDGILFIADSKAAAVVALDTNDRKAPAAKSTLKVEGINKKIAALLGTAEDQVLINDMAINPESKSAYLAVSRGRGPE